MQNVGPVGGSRVALFSGGRGGASISAELARRPDVQASIIVNGYDDGLSTGALRGMIPGLLGPSDFRKVFAGLLDPAVPGHRALGVLLRYRLSGPDGVQVGDALRAFALGGGTAALPPELAGAARGLDASRRRVVRECLARYFDHVECFALPVDYSDFALGNIVIAGMFLGLGDFNATIARFGRLCQVPVDVWNVSAGEGRWLVALTADGRLLTAESEIVTRRSASPIVELYLLRERPSAQEWRSIASGSRERKHVWLSVRSSPVVPSAEATDALLRSDLIIYGPGTQHSSLFPSYRIAAEALRASPAPVKALVVNLDPDEDIRGMSPAVILERALYFLGDPANRSRVVTHLVHDPAATLPGSAAADRLAERCAGYGIRLLAGRFRDPSRPHGHDGRNVVDALLAALVTASGFARIEASAS